jgi:hypothetical protein
MFCPTYNEVFTPRLEQMQCQNGFNPFLTWNPNAMSWAGQTHEMEAE